MACSYLYLIIRALGDPQCCWRHVLGCTPVRHGPALQHVPEVGCGIGQELTRTPIDNHAVLTDEIEHIELLFTVESRDILRIFVQPSNALRRNTLTFCNCCWFVDFILVQFRIDRDHNHAIVFLGALHGDIPVDNVV